MNRPHIAPLVALLLLWSASPSLGQDADHAMSVPVARQLLASADDKDQAWGAWMAGQLSMTDATPLLERIIREGLSAKFPPSEARVDIALDALIEIGAKPDVRLLEGTRRTHPVQSLILLSRLEKPAERVLLALLADSTGYQWFATANLLKVRKADGFAALVLKDLELTAAVVVSLDGRRGSVEGGVSGTVGDKAAGLAPGYPPWTVYEFRSCRSNLTLLAKGPIDVCYETARSRMGLGAALSTEDRDGPTNDHRLAYFEHEWSPVKLLAVEQAQVRWKSDDATRAALADVRAIVARKYATAIRALTDRGWLTAEEALALARPRIRDVVTDLRSPP